MFSVSSYAVEFANLVQKIKESKELCSTENSSPHLAWAIFLEKHTVSDKLRRIILTACVIPMGTAEGSIFAFFYFNESGNLRCLHSYLKLIGTPGITKNERLFTILQNSTDVSSILQIFWQKISKFWLCKIWYICAKTSCLKLAWTPCISQWFSVLRPFSRFLGMPPASSRIYVAKWEVVFCWQEIVFCWWYFLL